jgi:hypothetical protein
MSRNRLCSITAYAGALLFLAGVIRLAVPSQRLGATQLAAAAAVACGAALVLLVPRMTPPPLMRTLADDRSELGRILPEWHFAESHVIAIAAAPAAVDRAMREVTAGEMPLFRVLTWIRAPHLGARPAGLLNAPPGKPILATAAAGIFKVLADAPGREVVLGTLLGRSTRALMNFRIEPGAHERCRLVTETRVLAPDAAARRSFDFYWRAIFPGSALIRGEWLRAIRRRAERDTA